MSDTSRIFVSAASSKFGQTRQDVADILTSLGYELKRLGNELAGLRRTGRSPQRRLVPPVAAGVLLLAVVAGSVAWTIVRRHHQEEIAKALAGFHPQRIRLQLENSIRECYEQDAARARRVGDRKGRKKALIQAAQARDQKFAQLDNCVNSIRSTIASGRASPEFLELNGILQDKGVDAAVEYLSRQQGLLGGPRQWARTHPRVLRIALAPLLEGVWLQRNRGDFVEARRLCERLLAADPDWPEARDQYVATMTAGGQRALGDERAPLAWERFQSARASAERLVQLDPTNPDWQSDLSAAYLGLAEASADIGRLDSASELLDRQIEIAAKRAAAEPASAHARRALWLSYESTGDLCRHIGRIGTAARCYQQGVELATKLVSAEPADSKLQHELSVLYEKLGTAHGRGDTAQDCLMRSLDLRKKVASTDPGNGDLQRELSVLYEELGDARWPSSGREYYQQSLGIRQRLAAADPADFQRQRDLSLAYAKLADDCRKTNHADAAREFYQKELGILRKLATVDSTDTDVQRDLADLDGILGSLAQNAGQMSAARDFYQEGLDLRTRLAAAEPDDSRTSQYLRMSYSALARMALVERDYEKAVQICERGTSALQRMTDNPRVKAQVESDLKSLQWELSSCRETLIAVGPLEKLLMQPAGNVDNLLRLRCSLLAARRDIGGVAQAAEALSKLEPKTPYKLYEAACGYCLCAKLAAGWPGRGPFSPAKGANGTKATDQNGEQKYLHAALNLLQAALKAGLKNAWIKQDPGLDALRDLPEFKKLLTAADPGRH